MEIHCLEIRSTIAGIRGCIRSYTFASATVTLNTETFDTFEFMCHGLLSSSAMKAIAAGYV
jgi:hypothetical protein